MPENKYNYTRPDKGVTFQIEKERFTKIFNLKPNQISQEEKIKRFHNALRTYQHFQRINWQWSPKLIDYSEKKLTLTIERLRLKSIHECLTQNFPLRLNWLIKKLIKLESDLIKNKINCQGITNKDILIDQKQLWLIDFEKTQIKKEYSESLFLQLISDLSTRWNTYYQKNKQKSEFRKKLLQVALEQLFSMKPSNIKRISHSFVFYSVSRFLKK